MQVPMSKQSQNRHKHKHMLMNTKYYGYSGVKDSSQ